jgi:hypothetical protein
MSARARLGLAFAVLILLWPLVHMTLTRVTGLNSWKLGGWGMYATTHPLEHGLVLLPYGVQVPRVDSLGPVLDEIRVLVPTSGDRLRELTGEEIPVEVQRKLFDHATNLLVLGQERHVRAYVAPLERAAAEAGAPARRSLLLVTEARLELLSDPHTYTRARVYRHDGGEVADLGAFASDELTLSELLARVADQEPTGGSR